MGAEVTHCDRHGISSRDDSHCGRHHAQCATHEPQRANARNPALLLVKWRPLHPRARPRGPFFPAIAIASASAHAPRAAHSPASFPPMRLPDAAAPLLIVTWADCGARDDRGRSIEGVLMALIVTALLQSRQRDLKPSLSCVAVGTEFAVSPGIASSIVGVS